MQTKEVMIEVAKLRKSKVQLGVKSMNKNGKKFIKLTFKNQEDLNQYREKFEKAMPPPPVPQAKPDAKPANQ